MVKTITIPAKEIKALIESHIMNELKTDKFKWVMKAGNINHPCVGDVKVEWEV